MAYKVLILDDDVDFNSLLTDIFEQADYIVTSILDPIEAIDVFKEGEYDLVVTDYKMPEMTGSEFMKAVKLLRPEVPVIMVSGYLENDTIRELISAGVGGVFLKPLNIFSLLERTKELIEESVKGSVLESDVSAQADEDSEQAKLGFSFRSYPCKCAASHEFAERLYQLRNFKSTISLIGEPGAQFRLICEDIRGFYSESGEEFVFFGSSDFDEGVLTRRIDELVAEGASRITFAILDISILSDAQRKLAVSLAKCEGAFEQVEIPIRVIFCVSGDLDSLYDEGLIDENLYILMGTAEVSVPSLREVSSDVPFMAQQILAGMAREREQSTVPQLDKAARDFLQVHRWPENYAELYRALVSVFDGRREDIIRLVDMQSAVRAQEVVSPRARFVGRLMRAKVDYIRAVTVLNGGDYNKTADFFGVELATIEDAIK
ncbi:sigma-54-dependent transcriptional regulator [Coraliomargarita akajimensis]|uniref:Putative two component, sigma54 specific, transcriptional regulator, Fis family n=1 Tax=Coraliomargarita akajimensis (strain DSM 45221 / IAM 15411 / JCM 23193 / KCTC 12865 / 04OKA010-24) TaxID=583355 RepID=D5EIT5_CORAD|nr:response regulator [Coraliomargarita akajimensis]ADE54334.1 putative two component, sigma54 specific, transcriptional regulator, Fis family [Coraliomargarita akajimensis DSM 45221]